MTVEQQLLTKAIVERVGEIQAAVQRALPSNAALHAEFAVGEASPTRASEAVALARRVEPAAKEYRSLLVGRGVDGAKLTHLAQMAAALDKLLLATPESAPSKPARPGKKPKS
jgi:hypothetical protein